MSTDSSAPTSIGWYGKLPSAGDFLQRRLPDPVVNNWAHWFHNGLVNLQRDAQGPNGHPFSNAPVWNFVIPATLGSPYVQMGCLLPARDRVGRRYPICALRLFSQQDWRPQQLNMAASWYQQLGYTLLNGVRNGFSAEQIDRTLQAIPALPSPPIALVEIERLQYQGTAISASWVRKLLAAGDFHAAAPLVPPDTLYYLQDLQTQRRAKAAPHPFESAQSGE